MSIDLRGPSTPRPTPSAGTEPAGAFDFGGGRVLFVASTGGHLSELHRLEPAMNAGSDSTWVTFDSDQSRSLLRGRRTEFVPYIRPRDLQGTLRGIGRLRAIIERERPVAVVSTGAGVALSAFLPARRRRIPCHYVESVSRITGPSLTGRLVAALRLADLRTQHAGWAGGRWSAYPSLLSDFEVVPAGASSASALRPRVFVTLGTIQPYRFDALVDAVLATGMADERTVWQLGATSRTGLPGRAVATMGAEEFRARCLEADVVITHAGVGTVLDLLEAGIYPVVVPRRAVRHEHVDDHQQEIAALLRDVQLSEVHEADALAPVAIRRAARRGVRVRADGRVA